MPNSTTKLGRAGRLVRNISVVLLSPILFLAGLEGILRLADFGDPAEFWVPMEGREAVQTNHFFGRRFFPAAAARTPEPARIDIPKPEVVDRIFVVGGSAAMGFPEPGFSFGIILAILLEAR